MGGTLKTAALRKTSLKILIEKTLKLKLVDQCEALGEVDRSYRPSQCGSVKRAPT